MPLASASRLIAAAASPDTRTPRPHSVSYTHLLDELLRTGDTPEPPPQEEIVPLPPPESLDVYKRQAQTLRMAQRTLDEAGLSHVHICPETMGKLNQLGDLEEVLGFCELDERFTPCIDCLLYTSVRRAILKLKEDH